MTIRLALRSLLRSPAYAATSIGTIALTISLAATVFAIVDGVLFKPLPYREADRLFRLIGWDGRPDTGGASVAALDLKYLSEADPRVQVTGIGMGSSFTNPDRPDLTFWMGGIDPAFFEVLGQYPLVGGFTPDDYAQAGVSGSATPAIATHTFWRQWLNGDPAVVGRTVAFGSRRFVIRGVLPRDFVYPSGESPSLLVPLVVPDDISIDRWRRIFTGIVRLREGITLDEARARLNASLAPRTGEYVPRQVIPGPYVGVRMRPLVPALKSGHRELFSAALAIAGVLVLLGAVNVAGLFGARSRDRQRELAIRAALGGSRVNLIATLLSEAILIAVGGAMVGIVLAGWMLAAALSLFTETFHLLKDPSIDIRVVAFATTAAVIPVLVCSFFPAVGAMRAAPARRLAGSTMVTSRTRGWGRGALLAVESALGIILVVLGALILTSFVLVRSQSAGFDTDQIAIVELIVPDATSLEAYEAQRLRAFDRMKAIPGVRGAAAFDGFLLKGMYAGSQFSLPAGAKTVGASDIPVTETFFEVAGLRLVQGRFPTRMELARRERVAAVSEDTAAAYWPGRSAVGQVLEGSDVGPITVVGVVEDARFVTQDEGHGGEIYIPQGMRRAGGRTYLLKTAGDPADVIQDLALILRRDVPGVLVRRAESFDRALANSVRDHRARMVMFSLTGGSGLLLLVVGVVGIVASGVARRVREIGIRAALGAQQPQLVRMIVLEYLKPIAVGVACGMTASWWAARLVEAFVYQIDVHEPFVFAAAVATLLLAAAIAAWIPARRASAVDPVSVLRAD